MYLVRQALLLIIANGESNLAEHTLLCEGWIEGKDIFRQD